MAFTEPIVKKEEIWEKMPQELDVLITHIPPFGVRDQTVFKKSVGCKRLLAMVQKIAPKIHIFGHIHEGYGNSIVGPTRFYNVCYLDATYTPKNIPTLIEIAIPQNNN
jgi:Icc-related predicted phosphoesterase